MELTTTYTSKSLRETNALTRKWHFWPLQILGNVRAALYLVVGLVVGGRLIYDGLRATPINQHSVEKGLLVFVGLSALLYLVYYRKSSALRKAASAQVSTRLRLESNGLTLIDPSGATVFEPWTLYSTFRVRTHIVALTRADSKGYRTIPTDTLDPNDRAQLRSTLLAHLPEAN